MSRPRGSGRLALAGWYAVLAGVTAGLHRTGTGPLAPPPMGEPARWGEWLAGRDPVAAAVALIRLLALVGAWYLLAAFTVGAVLRLCRAQRLVRWSDRVTVPALRRLLVATASVTLASGVTPTVAAVAVASPGQPPAAARSVAVAVAAAADGPEATTTTTTAVTPSSRPPPTLTMRLLPPVGVEPAPVLEQVPRERGDQPGGTSWTVRPGECFWSIAADALQRAWGRAPTDAEIVPYWRALIEQNRLALADRANPSLIFPGQVFSVPAAPAAPPGQAAAR